MTWAPIIPQIAPTTGGSIATVKYEGPVKTTQIMVLFNYTTISLCTKVDKKREFKCVVPPNSFPGVVPISIIVGGSEPHPSFNMTYEEWDQWAPSFVTPPDVNFQATELTTGLPKERSAEAQHSAELVLISASIAFGVILIVFGASRYFCPTRCKSIAFMDLLNTPGELINAL
jgi:hypothetical protein